MPATATTTILYTVAPGDTLSKLAQRFYGNAQHFPTIVAANDIADPNILPVGFRLKIPNVPNVNVPDELSEVAVTAQRLPAVGQSVTLPTVTAWPTWMKDWRVIVGGGLIAAALLYYFFGRGNRR